MFGQNPKMHKNEKRIQLFFFPYIFKAHHLKYFKQTKDPRNIFERSRSLNRK